MQDAREIEVDEAHVSLVLHYAEKQGIAILGHRVPEKECLALMEREGLADLPPYLAGLIAAIGKTLSQEEDEAETTEDLTTAQMLRAVKKREEKRRRGKANRTLRGVAVRETAGKPINWDLPTSVLARIWKVEASYVSMIRSSLGKKARWHPRTKDKGPEYNKAVAYEEAAAMTYFKQSRRR